VNKKILVIICFSILISLIPIVFSREYDPIDCSTRTGYCYMDSKDGTAILTNNPRIRNYIMVQPQGLLEPVLEDDKTYLEKAGVKVLKGNDFVTEKKEVGDYDKWLYNFSNSAPSLENGEYTFHTKLKWIGTTTETAEYTFTDIIDVTPPTIDEIKLYENGVTDKSDTKTIEKENNATVKVKVKDFDGGATSDFVPDTKVVDLCVCIDQCFETNPCVSSPDDNGFYSFNITNPSLGWHTLYFYAQDNLTNRNDPVDYTFSVNDTEGPEISLYDPIDGYAYTSPITLVFSTSENAICNLSYENGDDAGQSLIYGQMHTFENVNLNPILLGYTSSLSKFNIYCEDEFKNPHYEIIEITYAAYRTLIKRIESSRGTLMPDGSKSISTYEAGGTRITSLKVETTTPTICKYLGDLTPFTLVYLDYDQLYGTMKSFGDVLPTKTHSIDLTQEINERGIDHKTYEYYALCKDSGGGYTELNRTNFTINIELTFLETLPEGVITDTSPELNFTVNIASYCRYKQDISSQWIDLGPQKKHSYIVPITGPLDYGSYSYDVECSLAYPLTNIVSTQINFSVIPELIAPILWELPSETEDHSIDVIGYTNQSGVDINIFVIDHDLGTDIDFVSKAVTGTSQFKGQYFVGSKRSDNTINIDEQTYKAIQINADYVEFSGHDGEYFRRYNVVDKSHPSLLLIGVAWIKFDRDFTENINSGETFSVYDTIYPEGWFNLTVNLKANINNSIIAISTYLNLDGGGTTAGPVYFHINPPVLYDSLDVVGNNSEFEVSGHAKAGSIISINHSGESDSVIIAESIAADEHGEFSTTISLYPGLNSIYARVIDQNDEPLSDASNELNVYYDNEGPDIIITQPSLTTNQQNVEIRANLRDYSEIVNIILSINDTPPYTYTEEPNDVEVSFLKVTSPLSKNGTYLINLTAEDRFGNKNSTLKQFILDTSMPDPAVFNLDGDFINYSSPVLNFTFNQEVEIYALDGVAYISNTTEDNMVFLFTTQNLAGLYEISVTASALEGGTAGTYPFEFTVDTTKPAITIGQINLSTTDYITFRANVSGECIDEYLDKVYVCYDTMGCWETDCIDEDYYLEIPLGTGSSHTITTKAIDLAGNSNSTTQVIDTGVPEINITNIIGNGIMFTQEPYKTNSDKVTINGTYSDENFYTIKVLLNGVSVEPLELYIDDITETFELNITLKGSAEQETRNDITIIAYDTSEFEDRENVTITKDLRGPLIIEFEPETYVTDTKTPTINITTNEYADVCVISYTTELDIQNTQIFNTNNSRDFSVDLDISIKDMAEAQNILITCNDSFSNIRTETIPLIVDLLDPSIESFDLVYPKKLAWETDSDYKKYLIKELNTQPPIAASVALSVKPDENARCEYYGSRWGKFANYEYLFSEMQSDNFETLEDDGEYTFNIICEDKAGRLSEVKVINVVVNSTHPVSAPLIWLDYPPKRTGTISTTKSPTFNGSIISLTPDAYITESKLIINGTTYDLDLDVDSKFSKTINPLPADDVYPFTILANNSAGNATREEGSILIDTTGPGGCINVGNITYCI